MEDLDCSIGSLLAVPKKDAGPEAEAPVWSD